jgi:hypothetical protein
MDVTPPKKVYEAMEVLVDRFVGVKPLDSERSSGALQRRQDREAMFDVLHRFYGLAMRQGAAQRDKEVREAIANGQPIPN